MLAGWIVRQWGSFCRVGLRMEGGEVQSVVVVEVAKWMVQEVGNGMEWMVLGKLVSGR